MASPNLTVALLQVFVLFPPAAGLFKSYSLNVQVNGHVIDGLTHERAVALLAKSRESITLVVRHEDPPAGLKVGLDAVLTYMVRCAVFFQL